MIRNIIFDWSGTLVDDLPAVWKATNYVLSRARRAEMTLEDFRAKFRLPFTGFYSQFVPHIPLRQLETWYHRRFEKAQHSVRELRHAREFLEFCHALKLRSFLLSSVHQRHFATQSAATGFGRFFERCYIGVRDKRKKIHEILLENGLRAEETMFVGDMQHDIETARLGGIHSCAVLTGYNTLAQLRAAKPDLIVEHLGELQNSFGQNGFNVAAPARARNGKAAGSQARIPVATVGALIFNPAGEVLLVRTHKWSDRWGIPGGKIKWGESSTAALRREIREETNLEITGIEQVLTQDCIRPREFYRPAHFILVNYTCRTKGSRRVRLNEEASAFRWVKPGKALTLAVNRPTRRLLSVVLENSGNNHARNGTAEG